MTKMTAVVTHHITVTRTARYYTLGVLGPMTQDVWIVCHGYGQLAGRFIEAFRGASTETAFIVAPEALSRFYLDTEIPHTLESKVGALWMTREDRDAEILDIVSYLDAVYEQVLGQLSEHGIARDQVRVHGLGFSQGAAAVSRWVARGTAQIDHLVLWGSGVPDDVNLRALHDRVPELSLDLVYGTADRWVTTEALDAQKARLEGAKMPYRIQTFVGGHQIDSAMTQVLFKRGDSVENL